MDYFRSLKRGRDSLATEDFSTPAKKLAPAPAPEPPSPEATPPPLPTARCTPVKAACVTVDPLVKRVYALINARSALDWGLTSDWAVTGPRRASAGGANAAPPRSGPTGNSGSEGYGEMTEGSIERLLLHLRRLPALATPPAGTTAAFLGAAHELGPHSRFLDVGSGYGKVVLHAALSGTHSPASSAGVEYVPSRAAKAAAALHDLRRAAVGSAPADAARAAAAAGDRGLMAARLAACDLREGDATVAGTLAHSHVYMYDMVFTPATLAALVKQLNGSGGKDDGTRPLVLISYRRPVEWRKLGLKAAWVHVSHVQMRTTGGQSFRAYIFARQ